MFEGYSDTDLIKEVLDNNPQAYAEIVQRYSNYVFTLALRYTQNREDAEEVSQDIFVKAYRSLSDFRGTAKFSTWLYTIVHTTSLTFLRKKKQVFTSIDDERTFLQLESQDGGLKANQVEHKSRSASLNQAIRMLSPEDAQIITLFYKAEQSLEEIASIMALEANTVKVRLHRARQRLRDKLETHFRDEVQTMRHD